MQYEDNHQAPVDTAVGAHAGGLLLCALTVSAEETPVDGVYADRISNPYAQPREADIAGRRFIASVLL